jgi:hypothetical protein
MGENRVEGRARDSRRKFFPVEALALAAVFVFVALFSYVHNTRVAGGADSWGYMAGAERLSHFRFFEPERVYSPFGQREDANLSHPLGLVSKGRAGTVPRYPWGYSLLMVPFLWLFGLKGAFWVVPLLAAGAVVLTYLLGRSLLGPAAGGLAAGLLFVFPNFLFSAFNPMSDVPAAFFVALALLALLSLPRRASSDVLAGCALGIGFWVRPNLALVAAAVAVWLAARREWGRLLRVGLILAPFVLVQGAVNLHLYGVPWRTGYGDPVWGSSLTAALARAGRYFGRLHAQQAGIGLFLLGASLVFNRLSIAVRALLLGILVLFVAFFAFYRIDDPWWYFRFILPAMPAVALLESGFVARLLLEGRRFRKPRRVLAVAVAALFAFLSLAAGRSRGVYRMAKDEQKYVRAALMARRLVKSPAVVLAKQHSGSLRFYAGLATTRYDLGLREQLARLRAVEDKGGSLYVLAEDWEVDWLRARYPDFDSQTTRLGTVEPNHVSLFKTAKGLSFVLRGKRPGRSKGDGAAVRFKPEPSQRPRRPELSSSGR